jgi:hypothetical protein
VFGFRYRHKANVTVWAEAYRTPHGVVLEVRPSVGAVGPFRLKIKKDEEGALITVIPMVAAGSALVEADRLPKTRRAFRNEVVSQGETVSTSAIFHMTCDLVNLVGWFVILDITGRGIFRDGLNWQSRVFVPVPDNVSTHAGTQ